jgi:hypothetical protein
MTPESATGLRHIIEQIDMLERQNILPAGDAGELRQLARELAMLDVGMTLSVSITPVRRGGGSG